MESTFFEMAIYGPLFGVMGTLIGLFIRRGAYVVYATMTAGFAVGWVIALLPKQKSETQVTHNITEYVSRDYRMDWTPVVSNISHGAEMVSVVLAVGLVLVFLLYIHDRLEKRRMINVLGQIENNERQVKAITGTQSKALLVKRETLPAVTKPVV